MKRLISIILITVMLFACVPQVFASDDGILISVDCADDSYIEHSDASSAKHFDKNPLLLTGGVYARMVYLSFDLSEAKDKAAQGVLLSFTSSVKNAGTPAALYKTTAFNGSSLSAENMPEAEFVTQLPLDKAGTNRYEFDVTKPVLEAIANGDTKVYFAIKSTGDTVSIFSRENSDKQNRPKLNFYSDTVFVPGQIDAEYSRPSVEQLTADIKANITPDSHPYIFGNKEDFARVKDLAFGKDELMTKWYSRIKAQAEIYKALDVVEFDISDRILSQAYDAWERVAYFGFVYQIEGDTSYAARAWQELENMAKLDNWVYTLLDNSSVALAVGLGYDWLYDYLTEAQRETLRTALLDKGLNIITDIYKNPSIYESWNNPTGTTQTGAIFGAMNHNTHDNSHYLIAALAVADKYPEYSAYIVSNALVAMEPVLDLLYPDGGYYEGTGYWSYIGEKLSLMLAALDSSVGNMYGYDKLSGIAKTGYYPLYAQSTVGNMVYNDMYDYVKTETETIFFLGKIAGDKSLQKLCVDREFTPLYMPLWYEGNENFDEVSYELDLDKRFRNVDVAVMRDTWEGTQEIFGGMRTQKAHASHQDVGSGGFAIDAFGERFVTALGKEDYSVTDYWNNVQDGTRWTYYARRAEGNNCLVINPDRDPGQDVEVKPTLDKFVSKEKGGYTITDLTEAYAKNVKSYKRGFMFTDNRSKFIVRDEATMKAKSEAYWFMSVKSKDITILEDGKSALIKKNGKMLYMRLDANAPFELTVMDSVPLPTSPNPADQTIWREVKKLSAHFTGVEELVITAEIIPILSESEIPTTAIDTTALDNWSIPDGECVRPMLDSFKINGEVIEGFDPYNRYYELPVPSGELNVEAISADCETKVDKFDDRIEITVTKNGVSKVYLVKLVRQSEPVDPAKLTKLSISKAYASEDDGNVPANTIDGNLASRWSAFGEQWITFDLGSKQKINIIGIDFYQGEKRKAYFDILVSENGKDWKHVVECESTGTSAETEYFSLGGVSARYVRYQGYGTSAGKWNSILEANIYR